MNKYHNTKVTIDGIKFDSKKEAKRYQDLKLLEKAGCIYSLQRQVPFVLIPKSQYGRERKYIADFTYFENDALVVEDVKSKATKTREYELKKRMLAERYGIVIREV